MKKHYLVSMLLVLLLAAIAPAPLAERPQSVSLVQLLASPEKHHGQFVRVEGFLHNKFEDSALYLSKPDGDFLIGKNALWVSYSDEVQMQPRGDADNSKDRGLSYFDRKFVLLEGRFDKDVLGHMGAYSGGLTGVTRIMELKRYYEQGGQ
jgi:hypothetical protein